MPQAPRLRSAPAATARLAAMLALALCAAGCTRAYYRNQADREVRQILNEKNLPGRWGVPNLELQYDPRSRYFDGTNPDHPPMPPDDPFSHRYMHWIDGKRGARNYHVDGDLAELPNPYWREQLATYAEVGPDGVVHLTLDDIVQLAVIHEPDYREQLEELYFSALDVSTERFRFDTQFFGTIVPLYTHQSKNAIGAGGNSSDTLAVADTLRVQRQFATGGQLLVGFANSIVWQFAGPDTNTNVSLINFNLVQPLLRAGGRRFILEQLTIVERALLANLRAFERYRQGFYTDLAIGDGGTTGAQRRGGFFGGTGLTGFTGQGSSGFGGVGDITGFGRGGAGAANGGGAVTGGFAGGGAGTLGGYLGLLQQTQQIRNQRLNLNSQLRTLKLLQANLDAGTIDIAQVDQFRQNIETSRATLLQSVNGRQNTLETYIRSQIGLPPDLPIELDDAMIRQFQFIDPKAIDLYERLEDFVDELGGKIDAEGRLPDAIDVDVLAMMFDRLADFRAETAAALQTIQDDLELLATRADARKQTMTADEAQLFDVEVKNTVAALAELQDVLQAEAERAAQIRRTLNAATREQTFDSLVQLARSLASLVQESSLIQVRARLESITLDPVELEPQLALEIARANRFDWMNNRAALVDSWRLIAYNARPLLAGLNVTIDGNLSTRDDNPVKFESSTGTMRAGLAFDAPLTRLIERNNYRSALIEYQRDRRQLIQYEDQVNQSLRQTLRLLEQLEINLEIQRRAVVIAARRVDQTREVLSKPPEPAAAGQPAAGLGPTAALNLLTALNDLQSSQNNFMSVWLNHYAARMLLMRELGLMEIDDRGLWIDRPLSELLANVELTPAEELPPDAQPWLDALERLPVDEEPAADESTPALLPPEGEEMPQLTPPQTNTPTLRQGRRSTPAGKPRTAEFSRPTDAAPDTGVRQAVAAEPPARKPGLMARELFGIPPLP